MRLKAASSPQAHARSPCRFCGECLQPCLQVPSPLCPLCRLPFDPKKVDKAAHVEKQLSSYKAPCRGCNKKVPTPGALLGLGRPARRAGLWSAGAGPASAPPSPLRQRGTCALPLPHGTTHFPGGLPTPPTAPHITPTPAAWPGLWVLCCCVVAVVGLIWGDGN